MVKKKEKKYPLWFESPMDSVKRMQDEFERNIREMWTRPWLRVPELKLPEFPRAKFIPVRLGETNEQLILRAELPGFSKDEIKLKVTPTTIDISAEKKRQSIEKEESYFKMERGFASARRVLTLPKEVKTEGIRAKFRDGLLEVVLEKKEKEKAKEKKVKID